MTHIASRQNPTQPLPGLTVRIGEESEELVLVSSPGDAAVGSLIFFYDPDLLMLQESPPTQLNPQSNRVFTIIGSKAGTGVVEVWEIPSRDLSVTKKWTSVNVVVANPSEPGVDLYYFGKYLVWQRLSPPFPMLQPALMFSASSGVNQWAAQQGMRDSGPLPEGLYTLLAQLDPLQSTAARANMLGQSAIENPRDGIQFLPTKGDGKEPLNDQWGSMRVKLNKVRFESRWFRFTPAFGSNQSGFTRFGFYLHNSHKGFSHGCVEVGRNLSQQFFFDALVGYAASIGASKRQLTLRVSYRDQNTVTKGDTKF